MSRMEITAVTKLKHADLHAAAKKLGGQSALARELGVSPTELGTWCNLKAVPPAHRREQLEPKLLALTGKLMDELFPPELCEAEAFLASPKTIEITKSVEMSGLLEYAADTSRRLAGPMPVDEVLDAETTEKLKATLTTALKKLTWREREIVKMRHGLGDGYSYTLEEVGRVLNVSKERVRQTECVAMRKLQANDGLKLLANDL